MPKISDSKKNHRWYLLLNLGVNIVSSFWKDDDKENRRFFELPNELLANLLQKVFNPALPIMVSDKLSRIDTHAFICIFNRGIPWRSKILQLTNVSTASY